MFKFKSIIEYQHLALTEIDIDLCI